EAARLAGRKGDALVATEARSDLVKAFISAGGSGPRYAEVALCYAEHVEAARKTAHRYFRWSVTGWPVMAELPDTEGFAAASKHVSPDTVARLITCGPSAEHHFQAIDRYVTAGYDHNILVQVGPEQVKFIDFLFAQFVQALAPKSNIAALRTPDISSARQLTIVIAATWDGLTLSVGPERGASDVRSDACAELIALRMRNRGNLRTRCDLRAIGQINGRSRIG